MIRLENSKNELRSNLYFDYLYYYYYYNVGTRDERISTTLLYIIPNIIIVIQIIMHVILGKPRGNNFDQTGCHNGRYHFLDRYLFHEFCVYINSKFLAKQEIYGYCKTIKK